MLQLRNFISGLELFKRVGVVAETEGHHPDLHLESWNKAYVVLSTHSIGAPLLLRRGRRCTHEDQLQILLSLLCCQELL